MNAENMLLLLLLGAPVSSWIAPARNKRRVEISHHKVSTSPNSSPAPPTSALDIAFLRSQFDIFQNSPETLYLDSAATSLKPRSVVDAVTKYYTTYTANVHRGAHALSRQATAQYEQARDHVAEFIKANERSEVIFTSGATQALNLVAHSYGTFLKEGDEILLTVAEHHSNLVCWQLLAAQKKLNIKYVPYNYEAGNLDWEKLPNLVNHNTKLVSFQHVSNVLGAIHDVSSITAQIRNLAHRDCVIVLDACQSVPHMPVNVQNLGVDFLAASSHKICGPTGAGFLWGREDLLNAMPPYVSGGEMIDQVRLESSTFLPAPARFEAGTPPIAQAIGMGAATQYLSNIGMDNIAEYEHELASYLYTQLSQLPGITVLGPKTENRAALAAFTHESIHPSDLATLLDLQHHVAVRAGHHCCQPLHNQVLGISHSARASLYFYNTHEEIDRFVNALADTIEFFTSQATDNGDESDDFVPFV